MPDAKSLASTSAHNGARRNVQCQALCTVDGQQSRTVQYKDPSVALKINQTFYLWHAQASTRLLQIKAMVTLHANSRITHFCAV